ncbi:MAG: helix-turn-helix domain-containing protein [Phenylobacterium sp.]|uniref:helix-turn-helix domain-containing protein n=1 Tax=Phenylobacterium sp. TaxID=1871053 RepID=UPI0011F4819A|nr:helix-turn-helix domain-containing protein [Phenylobacterium sp.]TAJ74523.1 MAG: helix-turn-helix domain-containing protein [Phenylobacterium sp.]
MLRKRTSKKGELSGRDRMRAMLNLRAQPGAAPEAAAAEPEDPPPPVDPLMAYETLGEALKAVRHDRGLTLIDVAERTRVRRAYLEAIEEMRLDALPSRPFTIGYIRAYATALGLDPDLAIERFKSDEPVLEEALRAPVGMIEEKDPRVAAFLIGALVIIAAIVLWNVAQRAMMAAAPPPPLAPAAQTAKALAQLKGGTMELGYPLPAPVESTTPPPYETPGLAAATGLKADPNAPPAVAAPPTRVGEPPPVDLASLPATFTPKGRVYDSGNPRQVSVVTVQAIKAGALIVRGPDGSVYFARQLAKGEAYRVPQLAGLTLDVSAPHDFQVFVAGQSKGVLPAQQVLASKLGAASAGPPPAPRPATAAPAAPPAAPTIIRPPPASRPPAP